MTDAEDWKFTMYSYIIDIIFTKSKRSYNILLIERCERIEYKNEDNDSRR